MGFFFCLIKLWKMPFFMPCLWLISAGYNGKSTVLTRVQGKHGIFSQEESRGPRQVWPRAPAAVNIYVRVTSLHHNYEGNTRGSCVFHLSYSYVSHTFISEIRAASDTGSVLQGNISHQSVSESITKTGKEFTWRKSTNWSSALLT